MVVKKDLVYHFCVIMGTDPKCFKRLQNFQCYAIFLDSSSHYLCKWKLQRYKTHQFKPNVRCPRSADLHWLLLFYMILGRRASKFNLRHKIQTRMLRRPYKTKTYGRSTEHFICQLLKKNSTTLHCVQSKWKCMTKMLLHLYEQGINEWLIIFNKDAWYNHTSINTS